MLVPPSQKYFVTGPSHHGSRKLTILLGTPEDRTMRQWLYRRTRRLPYSAGIQTRSNEPSRQPITTTGYGPQG
jgi:hypothetical protein